jgi:hypothetical protein
MTALETPQSAPDAREHWLAEGAHQLAAGDYDAAIESFEHAVLAAERIDWRPLFRLAEAYLARGAARAALVAFEEAATRRFHSMVAAGTIAGVAPSASAASVPAPTPYMPTGTRRWAGQPLGGRTLRVECARSVAEVIARFPQVLALAAHGVDLILTVPLAVHPLVSRMAGPRLVLVEGAPIPPADFVIPFAALPIAAAGLHVEPCSLAPDAGTRTRLRPTMPATRGLLVAVVDDSPTASESLGRLVEIEGVCAVDLTTLGRDLDMLAAALSAVDLVLTADPTIAHLAGALGVSTRLFHRAEAFASDGNLANVTDDAVLADVEPALRPRSFAGYRDVRLVPVAGASDGGPALAMLRDELVARAQRTPLATPAAARVRTDRLDRQ